MPETDPRRRILITGGSGFIGRAVTAELAGAGYDVVVLSRHPEASASCPPAPAPPAGTPRPPTAGASSRTAPSASSTSPASR